MNVGLIQLDGTLPNLALMKLSTWHKSKGDKVFLMRGNVVAQRLVPLDKVYISCVFQENKELALEVAKQFKGSEIGGIGINHNKLSEDIEHLMPDYDTFNCNYSLGFTSRGCLRKCSFCLVPEHEGMIRANCDIFEFWDKRHKEIVILDNNILALPEHFKKIAGQIKENNLVVDFNQGLDHRLLTPELCDILLGLKHKREIRFAFDNIAYKPTVVKALKMLKEAGLKDWGSRWYVYVSPTDTFETVYERMLLLHNEKQGVYVMRDRQVYGKKEFVALASWGNQMGVFKQGFYELLKRSKRLRAYKDFFDAKKNIDNEGKQTSLFC